MFELGQSLDLTALEAQESGHEQQNRGTSSAYKELCISNDHE